MLFRTYSAKSVNVAALAVGKSPVYNRKVRGEVFILSAHSRDIIMRVCQIARFMCARIMQFKRSWICKRIAIPFLYDAEFKTIICNTVVEPYYSAHKLRLAPVRYFPV